MLYNRGRCKYVVYRAVSCIVLIRGSLGRNQMTQFWCKGEVRKSLGKTSFSAIFFELSARAGEGIVPYQQTTWKISFTIIIHYALLPPETINSCKNIPSQEY